MSHYSDTPMGVYRKHRQTLSRYREKQKPHYSCCEHNDSIRYIFQDYCKCLCFSFSLVAMTIEILRQKMPIAFLKMITFSHVKNTDVLKTTEIFIRDVTENQVLGSL